MHALKTQMGFRWNFEKSFTPPKCLEWVACGGLHAFLVPYSLMASLSFVNGDDLKNLNFHSFVINNPVASEVQEFKFNLLLLLLFGRCNKKKI